MLRGAPGESIDSVAGPGFALGLGSNTRHSGDAATTSARSPFIVTRFASASPRNPLPHTEKRSFSEITDAIANPLSPLAEPTEVPLSTSTTVETPEAVANITPGSAGALKKARPVASVFTLGALLSSTVTLGANRPSAPNTASVAGEPATIFGGNTIVTYQVAGAGDCPCSGVGAPRKSMIAAREIKLTAARSIEGTRAARPERMLGSRIVLKRTARPARTLELRETSGTARDRFLSPERNRPESRARDRQLRRACRGDRRP